MYYLTRVEPESGEILYGVVNGDRYSVTRTFSEATDFGNIKQAVADCERMNAGADEKTSKFKVRLDLKSAIEPADLIGGLGLSDRDEEAFDDAKDAISRMSDHAAIIFSLTAAALILDGLPLDLAEKALASFRDQLDTRLAEQD
jgi:hypothetical protein